MDGPLHPPPAALIVLRPVGSGGTMTPLDFGRSVNPVSTMGQIKPPTLPFAPRGFLDPPKTLVLSKHSDAHAMWPNDGVVRISDHLL